VSDPLHTSAEAISVQPTPAPLVPEESTDFTVGVPVAIGVALVLSVIAFRIGRVGGASQRVGRWMPVVYVLIWSATLTVVTLLYASEIAGHWLLIAWLVFIVLAVASVGWLRGVASGIALAVEKRLSLGDAIRLGDIEGEVVAFGVRSVRVRSVDGTVHEIPNQFFMTESVANLSGDGGDSACEISVPIPRRLGTERAMQLARNAAMLTPLASPRHRPEVFLEPEAGSGQLSIRIRGYAFDPAYQDHYRSDVVARIHDAFHETEPKGTGLFSK
jgi:small-conductance mechanosensitive channel